MMRPLLQLAWIAALALVAAGATFWIKGPPARSFHCDPATLAPDEVCLEAVDTTAPVVWVDARTRSAWQLSGVPGSLLWNLDPSEDMQAFEAAAAARIAVTPRVIVYCGDENCGASRQIAARIRSLDLGAQVSVLRGGWRALREAGRVKIPQPPGRL